MTRNICTKHSIASVFLKQLRDAETQKDRALFRNNLQKLGQIFAYEISRTFDYVENETETPLGTATTHEPSNEIVVLALLRAGLPVHRGILDYFPGAENGFIATQRLHHKDGSFEISIDYLQCPDLNGKTVILCDAMLATGSSMDKSIDAIHEFGTPGELHLVSIIAATDGLDYIERVWPKATIWIAAQDEELTARSYVVPGLGDAGDLAFGGKTPE